MLMAWSHTTSKSLYSDSFPAHDKQVVSGTPAQYKLTQLHPQTTSMLCPANYHLQLLKVSPHTTTMSSPAQRTSFKNFSAAHDLMSCPPEHNTASSASKMSVQIPKSTPATVKNYPENALFAGFYSNATRKPLLPQKYEHNTPRYARKT